MSRFKWYRRWKGGIWYYNRLWCDLGRTVIWYWSKDFWGYKGGSLCTLWEENYNQKDEPNK